MKVSNSFATVLLAGLTVVAVHAGSQAPTQPPAPTTPVPAGGGRQGRGAVFPAQQRPPGDPAVIERGRSIYSVTCSACHGADARGGQLGGPNLLRSQLVLADQDGEAIIPVIQKGRPDKGMPPMPINDADAKAVATFLHHCSRQPGGRARRRRPTHRRRMSSSVMPRPGRPTSQRSARPATRPAEI